MTDEMDIVSSAPPQVQTIEKKVVVEIPIERKITKIVEIPIERKIIKFAELLVEVPIYKEKIVEKIVKDEVEITKLQKEIEKIKKENNNLTKKNQKNLTKINEMNDEMDMVSSSPPPQVQTIEKIVNVPVEKIVIKEVPVEKRVEVPIEIIVEKVI